MNSDEFVTKYADECSLRPSGSTAGEWRGSKLVCVGEGGCLKNMGGGDLKKNVLTTNFQFFKIAHVLVLNFLLGQCPSSSC